MTKKIEYFSFENLPETNVCKFWNGVVRSERLNAAELRLYYIIYTLKNCPMIYISRESMAERMGGCSTQKISDCLQALCDAKLITKHNRRTTKGKFTTNVYILNDVKEWLQTNGNDSSWSGVMPAMVFCPFLNDNELRLYLVLRSWSGKTHIQLAISDLIRFTNLAENTLLRVRKSLIEKGVIKYERRSELLTGNQKNEYYINDEDAWLKMQINGEEQ